MKIFGVVGWKNSGKTGLMERLVAEITAQGFRVSTLKHAHHAVDVDQPGKDSYRHRQAGAVEVVLASRKRWAMMHELRSTPEPELEDLLPKLASVDLVLVEGYKRQAHPKIEANRVETGKDLLARGDQTIRAVATNGSPEGLSVPVMDLDDTAGIARFILQEVGLTRSETPDQPPSQLRNDCFALPPGVDWTPVDEALDRLRAGLVPVTGTQMIPAQEALGRVLAAPAVAQRSNPPSPNAAVDGYGFAHAHLTEYGGDFPLVEGRAAAGVPFEGTVPDGAAIRILTGATIPDGVDTVVLQEDVTVEGGRVRFAGGLKRGANTRKAGEDCTAGETVLSAGTRLQAPDMALLASVGIAEIDVFAPLRVGVLSTGDELATPGETQDPSRIYDANRPMLLGLADGWAYQPVDLGRAPDDRDRLREILNDAAERSDVILTSGGASAGDEDHMSALLRSEGTLFSWRIALKPGRPLALGMWNGVPVFGLPGNPVAAFVCAVIFARPALSVLAGRGWQEPLGFDAPAAFTKRKKAGRSEFLRARLNGDRHVEVFASEGSGRVSGLSWADGLVSLGPEARMIEPGAPVTFLPYASLLSPS